MDERIHCSCGAALVDEVTERGVRPVGADQTIDFRRTTDFVICPECLRAYDVRSLIARAQNRETVERLEKIARATGAGA